MKKSIKFYEKNEYFHKKSNIFMKKSFWEPNIFMKKISLGTEYFYEKITLGTKQKRCSSRESWVDGSGTCLLLRSHTQVSHPITLRRCASWTPDEGRVYTYKKKPSRTYYLPFAFAPPNAKCSTNPTFDKPDAPQSQHKPRTNRMFDNPYIQ